MFDIMDFIDSEDVRSCNQKRNFLPIEQAVLIYASEKKNVAQKISAWRKLAEIYSAEDLPESQKILEMLRQVYQGNLNYGSFLELYSRYGRDAALR